MTSSEPRVITERRGHVLLIRMNRPDKRNAVDAEMTAGLDAALNTLDDDSDLRCGVLSGGPRNFCAGTDLVAGPGEKTARGGGYGVVGRRRTKPLVAAVEGFAYGGGMEMAFASDLVVAGESAQFALPEVTHGVIANAGALFRASTLLPPAVAKHLLLTGAPISAQRAFEYGLVTETVAAGSAEEAALAVAAQIAANAPVAVQETLRAVDALLRDGDDRGWTITAEADARVHASDDYAEGLAAFAEKREPIWRGR